MGMLQAKGCEFTEDAGQADIMVLNTCAIRDHAESGSRQSGALNPHQEENPEQIICLCGCMAQRPEVAEKVRQSYRHVDLVFGPRRCGSSRSFCTGSIPAGAGILRGG